LDSLINQTYRNIEIITFNDASTDDGLSILEEYACKDNRVKVINSLVNVRKGGEIGALKLHPEDISALLTLMIGLLLIMWRNFIKLL
jgi:glycosyltransferase involved in cell wall biosynthesis